MIGKKTPFEAHIDGIVVALLTAFENDLGDEACAIWNELDEVDQKYVVIWCLGLLRGALNEIERRGGPEADVLIQRLVSPYG